MEQLLLRSKCSIFHNIFKNLTFQRCPKTHVWSKGLKIPGPIAQPVSCWTADSGIAGLISAGSHTFVEIDHEIISTVLPFADSRRVVVRYKSMHEVLNNGLVKLAQKMCG